MSTKYKASEPGAVYFITNTKTGSIARIKNPRYRISVIIAIAESFAIPFIFRRYPLHS